MDYMGDIGRLLTDGGSVEGAPAPEDYTLSDVMAEGERIASESEEESLQWALGELISDYARLLQLYNDSVDTDVDFDSPEQALVRFASGAEFRGEHLVPLHQVGNTIDTVYQQAVENGELDDPGYVGDLIAVAESYRPRPKMQGV